MYVTPGNSCPPHAVILLFNPHRRSCGLHGCIPGSAPTDHVAETQPLPMAQVRAVRRRPGAARTAGCSGRHGQSRGADHPPGMAGRPGLTHTLTDAGRPVPRHRASSWGAEGRGQDAARGAPAPGWARGAQARGHPRRPRRGKPGTRRRARARADGACAHAPGRGRTQVHTWLSESAPGTAE